MTKKTTYAPGQDFDFNLVLLGSAVDYLPYFVLAFRDAARQGLGLNRAPCVLQSVWATTRLARTNEHKEQQEARVYSGYDELFRTSEPLALSDWVHMRLCQLGDLTNNGEPRIIGAQLQRVTVRYLTPTNLKSDGRTVYQPEFHHLFKRVRDRLNALCTFYGPGPIEVDFRDMGERSERVGTKMAHVEWMARSRRSSKTHQRHELSGFVGECTYEGDLTEFGPLSKDRTTYTE
jgi:hypothetical protein